MKGQSAHPEKVGMTFMAQKCEVLVFTDGEI